MDIKLSQGRMKQFILLAFLAATSANIHRHKHGGTYKSYQLKPGTEKNKLFPEYGTNFRYVGQVMNGLDRVTVVTSIPIPKYTDIDKEPMIFKNCLVENSAGKTITQDGLMTTMNEWCAKVVPFVEHLQKKKKYLMESLHDLPCEDLYAALPELKPLTVTKSRQRSHRGLGAVLLSAVPGLITLAVESLSSFIKGKQQKRIDDAVAAMRRDQKATQNRLQQYSNDFLMYGKYNVETLTNVINTVNLLHRKPTRLEKAFENTQLGPVVNFMNAMTFNFDLQMYLRLTEEEHVNQYEQLTQASKDLLKGIATLSQGRLPQELFPDRRLRLIIHEVEIMVKKQYPDYELAAQHISHYRDMKLVTFAVDQEAHALIVAFPVFIKDYRKPSLSMFEIETVSVPIPDKNKNADSYSRVIIHKNYIAVGADYYIQLHMTELVMCKSIQYTYYCEELFVVKHKSKHSCVSVIFFDLGPKVVSRNCKFDYTYNQTVSPVILDGGRQLLLANFHGPRSLKCNSQNGGLAKPAPEHTYAVVPRDFLCDCQFDLEHASVLHQLSSCNHNSSNHLVMEFVVNVAFYEILRQHNPKLVSKIKLNMKAKPQVFNVKTFW